jgi:hypothetical protein
LKPVISPHSSASAHRIFANMPSTVAARVSLIASSRRPIRLAGPLIVRPRAFWLLCSTVLKAFGDLPTFSGDVHFKGAGDVF